MEQVMSVGDLALKVLSRLSVKQLAIAKCVSKGWNTVINSSDFLQLHNSGVRGLSAFLYQCRVINTYADKTRTNHLPLNGEEECLDLSEECLAFLPEKVTIMSSCNGLLCCLTFVPEPKGGKRYRGRKLMLYICNPISREWVALQAPKGVVDDQVPIALAFSGSCVNLVVMIRCRRAGQSAYTFVVYSSDSDGWRSSKEVCYCEYTICIYRHKVVGSRCHWLTEAHHIVTFDLEKEQSAVIKLPGDAVEDWNECLGSSEGYLHYLSINGVDLNVWMLKGYDWVPKYCLGFINIFKNSSRLYEWLAPVVEQKRSDPQMEFLISLFPMAFQDDMMCMFIRRHIYSFDFKTEKLAWRSCAYVLDGEVNCRPILLPYTISLASFGFAKKMGKRIRMEKFVGCLNQGVSTSCSSTSSSVVSSNQEMPNWRQRLRPRTDKTS